VRDWRLDSRSIPKPLPPVVVVAGTAMSAGKTTAAANLIKGLHRAGKRVGAAKVTGTGAGGDYWQMKDAGACEVVDFTDAGYASTYMLSAPEVEKVFLRLLSHLGGLELDAIVLEVADGILQQESNDLLASEGFAFYCNRLLFAAGDAMGALAGVQWFQARGLEVTAVTGSLSASPLAARETTSALGLATILAASAGWILWRGAARPACRPTSPRSSANSRPSRPSARCVVNIACCGASRTGCSRHR
jgi:hypothetical protein